MRTTRWSSPTWKATPSRAASSPRADFVAERGGGLLVLGGDRLRRGLIGTPLEDVLPVELTIGAAP